MRLLEELFMKYWGPAVLVLGIFAILVLSRSDESTRYKCEDCGEDAYKISDKLRESNKCLDCIRHDEIIEAIKERNKDE